MRTFKNKFFKTREEALAFQEKQGGILYSNEKGSRTRSEYMGELLILGCADEIFIAEHPYVVSWSVRKRKERAAGSKPGQEKPEKPKCSTKEKSRR